MCLAECSRPVAAKELALGLVDAAQAEQRLALQFGGALKVGDSTDDVAEGEARCCTIGERQFEIGLLLRFGGERNRTLGVLEGCPEASRIQLGDSEIPGIDRPALRVGGPSIQSSAMT